MAKYISFAKGIRQEGRKTDWWEVYNKDNNSYLGLITYRPGWRKYIFAPATACIFEQVCLRDIANFIETATKDYKEKSHGKNICTKRTV